MAWFSIWNLYMHCIHFLVLNHFYNFFFINSVLMKNIFLGKLNRKWNKDRITKWTNMRQRSVFAGCTVCWQSCLECLWYASPFRTTTGGRLWMSARATGSNIPTAGAYSMASVHSSTSTVGVMGTAYMPSLPPCPYWCMHWQWQCSTCTEFASIILGNMRVRSQLLLKKCKWI